MSRFLRAAGLMAAAAVALLWLASPPPVSLAQDGTGSGWGGACNCPKYYKCCLDCSGNFICIRAGACPECPAP